MPKKRGTSDRSNKGGLKERGNKEGGGERVPDIPGTIPETTEPQKMENFDTLLCQNQNYLNLTKELEEAGEVKFVSKTPEAQKLELGVLKRLHHIKNKMAIEHDECSQRLWEIESGGSVDLMEMRVDLLVQIAANVQGKEVKNFNDLLQFMVKIHGADLEALKEKESMRSGDSSQSTDPDLWSPTSGVSEPLLSVSQTPSLSSANGTAGGRNVMFPTAKQMTQAQTNPRTPASSVFQFVGASGVMSTNKAPRLLKAGEVAFSQSGSPLLMPRLGGLDRKAERIPVNDSDGKKIVEVVIYKGDDGKDRQFKDIVTDIRGVVATRSISANKIRPPRVPRGGAPKSASKPPLWQP